MRRKPQVIPGFDIALLLFHGFLESLHRFTEIAFTIKLDPSLLLVSLRRLLGKDGRTRHNNQREKTGKQNHCQAWSAHKSLLGKRSATCRGCAAFSTRPMPKPRNLGPLALLSPLIFIVSERRSRHEQLLKIVPQPAEVAPLSLLVS